MAAELALEDLIEHSTEIPMYKEGVSRVQGVDFRVMLVYIAAAG